MIVKPLVEEIWEVAFLLQDGIGVRFSPDAASAGLLASALERCGAVVLAVERMD